MSYVTIDGIDYNEGFNVLRRFHYAIKEALDGGYIDGWECAHKFEKKIDYANIVNQGQSVVIGLTTDLFDETYVSTIFDGFFYVINELQTERNSRRAVIRFPSTTCLTSVQFQIRDDELHVTATYRSLLDDNVPTDYSLIKELGHIIEIALDCELKTLVMFATNYHFLR